MKSLEMENPCGVLTENVKMGADVKIDKGGA
jgi:hypothetical protein